MKRVIILFSAIAITMSSCRYRHSRHISGDGHISSEQRNVSGFTGIASHGDIDIIASQGDFKIKVETDQNLLQYIETIVENGRLIVRFRNGLSLYHFNGATVYVTAPELNAFETHGSGNITSQGKISDKNKIDIDVSGSGDIQLDMDCPEVKTETHGSGNITLTGDTKNFSCRTSGSGDVKAADLKAENVRTSIHGSGDNEVFASESLDVEIFGSGDVHYRGEPKISTSVHGSGSVSKM